MKFPLNQVQKFALVWLVTALAGATVAQAKMTAEEIRNAKKDYRETIKEMNYDDLKDEKARIADEISEKDADIRIHEEALRDLKAGDFSSSVANKFSSDACGCAKVSARRANHCSDADFEKLGLSIDEEDAEETSSCVEAYDVLATAKLRKTKSINVSSSCKKAIEACGEVKAKEEVLADEATIAELKDEKAVLVAQKNAIQERLGGRGGCVTVCGGAVVGNSDFEADAGFRFSDRGRGGLTGSLSIQDLIRLQQGNRGSRDYPYYDDQFVLDGGFNRRGRGGVYIPGHYQNETSTAQDVSSVISALFPYANLGVNAVYSNNLLDSQGKQYQAYLEACLAVSVQCDSPGGIGNNNAALLAQLQLAQGGGCWGNNTSGWNNPLLSLQLGLNNGIGNGSNINPALLSLLANGGGAGVNIGLNGGLNGSNNGGINPAVLAMLANGNGGLGNLGLNAGIGGGVGNNAGLLALLANGGAGNLGINGGLNGGINGGLNGGYSSGVLSANYLSQSLEQDAALQARENLGIATRQYQQAAYTDQITSLGLNTSVIGSLGL